MKNRLFLSIILFLGLLFTGCNDEERAIARFQRQLDARQEEALRYTASLEQALAGNSLDSVRLVTRDADGLLFYVFGNNGLVYWSDNWLAGQGVMYPKYDKWFFYHFDNAECVCRWTKVSAYNILTIIPVKYAYSFENQQLHNTFVAPFSLPKNLLIRQTKVKGSFPINDRDGNYIFSLYENPNAEPTEVEQTRLAESFSYQSILTTGGPHSHSRIHLYITTCVVFLVLLLCFGIYGLIHSHGISNMRLSAKFQYLIVTMLLISFLYVFVVSIRYLTERYEERQRTELQHKAKYIQKSLQDLYFWSMNLSDRNTQGMNVDLRDLCFSYESDINVYDMEGHLIGSSSPTIFEKGILSTHVHPEPFFGGNATLVRKEQIGDMQYMAAYTEFYNGNYVQIGYIEVPYYVAADEKHMAVDDFLSRLFPPYVFVMMLSVILALLLCRTLTRPLMELSEAMKRVEVGKRNKHLQYAHNDEVGEIVEQYNTMLDQLEESTEKLARTEREDAHRTMARQIAHEINNMLTPMKLHIQMLQRMKTTAREEQFDERFRTTTDALISNIDSLSNIASSFSAFAKMPEVQTSTVDIAQQLFSVITLLRDNEEQTPIRYVGAEQGINALADAEQIRQVFTNLIKNAIQAIGGARGGDIIVILKELNDRVEVSVSDNGCGIPEENRARVFVPYFTTKTTGTGLGLGISKHIVEGCGGKIWFDSSAKGTTFYVSLLRE